MLFATMQCIIQQGSSLQGAGASVEEPQLLERFILVVLCLRLESKAWVLN
jgi:hypothetical protein